MIFSKKQEPTVPKEGAAFRVIFTSPKLPITYVDHAHVIVYETGVVYVRLNGEEIMTHITNCEIIWFYKLPDNKKEDSKEKVISLVAFRDPKKGEQKTTTEE